MVIRRPAVAGAFYPADPSELREFCRSHIKPVPSPVSARAVILPHAGYLYSGQTACLVLSHVRVPEKNFLIGPNHQGLGSEFAVFPEGKWETPLGAVPVDHEFGAALCEASHHLRVDERAHAMEHSLEVQVPLLQTRNPALKIVPLIVGTLDLGHARDAAMACAEVLQRRSEPILLVISNDMSHYDEDRATRKKDAYALRAIENLDADALVKAVKEHRVTMCGVVPVFMLLVMAGPLGIKKAELVDYRTSADATGDRDRVVGYAGFIFE